jgi:xylan 1,4-beta-xylosidase
MTATPLLAGFHPDPTICRVGDDYYLATSSFEYFPGVPLFHSRNLTEWSQIGHILDRPSQLAVEPGIDGASKGIYAPTLRHHDGRFYLVTTNMNEIRRGHLIVHATDPAGPWSDPVYTSGAIGIDPDLAWDDDGTCHLTWCDVVRHSISQAVVDPLSGEVLSEPRELWTGSGLANTEGPHLYRRGDWWYLLVAEGGTHTGHAVSVARSRSISGPFEGHPRNPVFSHRSTADPVQATGHADLVELADGSWAAVYLGIRPRGTFPRFHVTGRETFLAGVRWHEGWPAFDEERFAVEPQDTGFTDSFAGPLDHRWVAPGRNPGEFAHGGADGLSLRAEEGTALCTRVRDHEWSAAAELASGEGSLAVRIDEQHSFGVTVAGGRAEVVQVIGSSRTVVASVTAAAPCVLVLKAEPSPPRSFRAGPDRLLAGIVAEDGSTQWLGEVDGRYVSTEVAGGFTGRMLALEAEQSGAVFRSVRYTAGPAVATEGAPPAADEPRTP